MKRRTIQPLLRFDLALLCACLVTSPPSAKADLILSVDVRIVAAAVIATLLLATFCILGLLSFSLRSKPKLTEHVKAP
ncbi:MAG: hypothetical protein EBT61_10050 [Verrucomicrobia bacterium]|nr:hypothetical protein [Verrucomicrobiota bacterium]